MVSQTQKMSAFLNTALSATAALNPNVRYAHLVPHAQNQVLLTAVITLANPGFATLLSLKALVSGTTITASAATTCARASATAMAIAIMPGIAV